MIKRVIKRFIELIMILLLLSLLVFALMYLAPGDPAEKRLSSQGIAVTKEMINAERVRMGLVQPFFRRYGNWLGGILHGDFGISFKDDLPVAPKLTEGLKNTTVLALGSLLFSLTVSVPLGIVSAVYKNSISDHIIRILSFVANSLPNYLISVLLMYVFCIRLNILPVIASGNFQGLLLPALSLAIPMAGRFIRQIRAEVRLQLSEEYVKGLRSRGEKEHFILINNVLRNTTGHIFTIVALQIGTLMGGSVVIETIFRWPGIGKLVMDSITARDYPVIMGFVLIMGTIYVMINLFSDIIYHMLDPRV